MNLRVPHSSRRLRRVGSYDRTPNSSVLSVFSLHLLFFLTAAPLTFAHSTASSPLNANYIRKEVRKHHEIQTLIHPSLHRRSSLLPFPLHNFHSRRSPAHLPRLRHRRRPISPLDQPRLEPHRQRILRRQKSLRRHHRHPQ